MASSGLRCPRAHISARLGVISVVAFKPACSTAGEGAVFFVRWTEFQNQLRIPMASRILQKGGHIVSVKTQQTCSSVTKSPTALTANLQCFLFSLEMLKEKSKKKIDSISKVKKPLVTLLVIQSAAFRLYNAPIAWLHADQSVNLYANHLDILTRGEMFDTSILSQMKPFRTCTERTPIDFTTPLNSL